MIGTDIMKINWDFDSSAYLIKVSDITKARNKYKKTLIVFNVNLFWTFENVNKKQHIKDISGI